MFTAVIDDEIHNEKEHTTENAKAIFNLRARRRLGLTGTFMSNSAMDTYGPLHYVLSAPCEQFPYARQAGAGEFEKRFCDFVYLERPTGEVDEETGEEIMKTVKKRVPFLKNPPEFWRFLADKIIRRTYDDPLYQESLKEAGLIQPVPDVYDYRVAMDPLQAKMLLDALRDFKQAYEKLVKECEAKHQEINLGKIQSMSQMMSMRILATCPEMINEKLGGHVYDGPVGGGKMFHINKIVAEAAAKNEKTLIISDFIQMQKTVTEELRKSGFGIIRFNPAWGDAKCEEAFDQFNDDPDIHGIVAGTRAIREGLDFGAANKCIATDLLWSPAFQTQAWSRILTPRPEDRHCEVYLMLSKFTIDEHVYNVFYSKMAAAEQALDRVMKERRTKQIDVKWFVDRILEEEEALSLQVRDLGDKDEVFMPSLEEALLEERV
jgi:SNF2 family DNA or RNA helicase